MSGRRYIGVSMKPPTDYILRYDFDGNLTDKSPNALHGVGSGTYAFDVGRKGLANEAIKFTAGCVKTPANLPIGTKEVSISFWVKENTGTSGQILCELGPNLNTQTNCFYVSLNELVNDRITFTQRITPGLGSRYIDGISLNEWRHVVVTTNNNSTNNAEFMKIYINGHRVSAAYAQNDIGTLNFGNFPLFIGARNTTSLFFNGWLQEFKVWNRELSAAEVRGLYLNNL